MVGGVRNVNDAERAPKPIFGKRMFAHSSNVGMGKLVYNSLQSDPQNIFSTCTNTEWISRPV